MDAQTEPGQIIAGKYALVRRLGQGSMGQVWVAHHCTLGEEVALKLLTPTSLSGDGEDPATASARFLFEAQVAARLSRRTPHIVRVTDHGEDHGLAYLVMELLEGETLEARLMRTHCLTRGEARVLVWQTSRALTEAHEAGVIHRDLKPANIFLTKDADGRLLVKLLDFGIAYTTHAHGRRPMFVTAAGAVFGTPGYMSPEQASPSSRLDLRCDLWALAAVAYEALTGELPFSGTTAEELLREACTGTIVPAHVRDPSLPAGLADFFERAFSRRSEDRYPTAHAFAFAFVEAIGEPALQGGHDSLTERSDMPPPSATSPMMMHGRAEASGARGRGRRTVLWIGAALAAPILVGFAAMHGSAAIPAREVPRVSPATSLARAPFGSKPGEEAPQAVFFPADSSDDPASATDAATVHQPPLEPAEALVPSRPVRQAPSASPISPPTSISAATTTPPPSKAPKSTTNPSPKPIDRDEVL
jgi:eukaryotic-like serine/threonine-protein kinase